MIEIQPFKVAHFEKMAVRQDYYRDLSVEQMARKEGTYAFALLLDGKVGAIIGAFQYWPGMIELWAVTSELMEESPLGFHRAALKIRDDAMLTFSCRRQQMTVRADFAKAIRWAGALGFSFEGLLRKYGPEGADYMMFSRVVS